MLAGHLMYQASYGKDAETVLKEGAKRWPKWPGFRYQLGAVALIKGDYETVIRELTNELDENPTNFGAWHYIGEAYLRLSELDKAAEALQRATWLNVRSARSYVLMGEIALLKENWRVAEDALMLALQLDPGDYQANFLLARVYHKTNRPELAKRRMEAADKLRQSFEAGEHLLSPA